MTSYTEHQAAPQQAGNARPPVSRRMAAGWSIRAASMTAGVALLLMAVLAIFARSLWWTDW